MDWSTATTPRWRTGRWHVWLLATGKPAVTTAVAPPESGVVLLCEVDTDGASVVEVRDRRTYATASRVVTLAGDLPARRTDSA